jgi:beta-phosphoglucomutase-like phosphatase (HAD superfamily)
MKRPEAMYQLKQNGIRQFFCHIAGRDEVPRGRPHPDLHLEAASRLTVPPRDCVLLEDGRQLIQLAIVISVQLLNRNRRLALVKPYGQL